MGVGEEVLICVENRLSVCLAGWLPFVSLALCHCLYCSAKLQAVACVHELEPRHVSNLAWSFAVRKAYSPALYDALAARIAELGVGALEPHHCSIVAWSFAKQGHKIESLMDSLGAYAAGVVDKLLPQVGQGGASSIHVVHPIGVVVVV